MIVEGGQTINCPNCEAPVPEDAAYCPSCGAPLAVLTERVSLPAGVLLIAFFQIIGSFLFLLSSYSAGSIIFMLLDFLLILLGFAFFMGYAVARWVMVFVFPVIMFSLVIYAVNFLSLYRSPPVSGADIAALVISVISFICLLTPGVGMYFELAAKRRADRKENTMG